MGRDLHSILRASARLGRFALRGRLATGGASTVLLARAHGSGGFSREFALKVVAPELDALLHRRLLDEAYLASRVRHPHVVASIDVGRDHGATWLALELVDGIDLRRLTVQRSVPMRPVEAALVVAMIARGAHAVHTAVDDDGEPLHAVHRDISPHNIMLDRDGRAVLIDFGIATTSGREHPLDVEMLCGRLPYMSPEQAAMGTVDAKSDVFSLGTVLFELVTQQLPFGEDDSRSTLERLQACDEAEIAAKLAAHGVPPGLVDVALVCMRRDPADRFASALELAEALEQELTRLGVDTTAVQRRLGEIARAACPDGPWVQPLPASRSASARIRSPRADRSRSFLRAGAVAAVVAVGLGSAWVLGGRDVLEPLAAEGHAALASDEVARRPTQFTSTLAAPVAPAPVEPSAPLAATTTTMFVMPPVPMPIVPAAAALGNATGRARATAPTRERKHRRPRGLKPNPYAASSPRSPQ
jgi:eukaryotic-like serine/threonine-protein kinase